MERLKGALLIPTKVILAQRVGSESELEVGPDQIKKRVGSGQVEPEGRGECRLRGGDRASER